VIEAVMKRNISAKWWSVIEADLRFGISPSTMRRLVAEGLVDARKIGGRLLINDESVDRYLINLPPAFIKPDDRSAKLVGRPAEDTLN
jgi:excisionase family DNA binding protein